jgi:ATP-binding cassette subfamily E protein 1
MPPKRTQRESLQRIAIIDRDRCKPNKCNHECLKICPVNRGGKICITIQGKYADIEELTCIGTVCGACVKVCPFKAIRIINLPTALTTEISHQYGPNSFRVHRMPIPKQGQILGLLGSNGTGKSTLLSILSGQVLPNLGELERQPEKRDLLRYYRGSELQGFFSRLFEGKIETAIKHQSIKQMALAEELPLTVGEWIRRFARTSGEKLDRVLDLLDLRSLLDRQIERLSGGELQRFALMKLSVKRVDAALIDEPSAFLDIKQRLRAGQAIRDLDSLYKIVVEHDLALLDYLSDYICLLWGEPSAYGVVSLPSSTGDAINQFLAGEIVSENMRIRPEPLSFRLTDEEQEETKRYPCCSYPDFRLELGDGQFELTVEGGDLFSSEIVVLLGENGTGKTSLIRVLAGDPRLKADREVDLRLTISHKPQMVEIGDSEATVLEALQESLGSSLVHSQFDLEVIRPLGVDRLFELRLNNLSGGELQRVAIALCLGKPADVYLLDEPSAFLDCEQRLAVSKVVKRFIMSTKRTAFVVEHDFMMASYLADRVIVYGGEPGRSARASRPQAAQGGINQFLRELGVTFRRDPTNDRPRVNKLGSVKDREQKASGNYY